jgi:hypothetical protein
MIFTKADYTKGFTLRSRASKAPIPLAGWALEMVVKATRDAVAPLLTITSAPGGGITIDAASVGRFVIAITADQMTDAIGAGDRVFAIYRTDGGQRSRIMSGRMTVREGI